MRRFIVPALLTIVLASATLPIAAQRSVTRSGPSIRERLAARDSADSAYAAAGRFADRREYNRAAQTLRTAIRLYRFAHDTLWEATAWQRTGKVRQAMAAYESALDAYNASLPLYTAVKLQEGLASAY